MQWKITEAGNGKVHQLESGFELTLPPGQNDEYSNAQISDYPPPQRDFSLQPPLRLTLQAQTNLPAEELVGTAGFGFWNHPYSDNLLHLRPPRAIWFFFASANSRMPLAKDVPGHGWKASTFDAQRWQFFALLPLAPLGFLLMRNPSIYDKTWHIAQDAIGVSESLLDPALLTETHEYAIEWLKGEARFFVDGKLAHQAEQTQDSPLGFIAWMDNQYAVVTPQGHFGSGITRADAQQRLTLSNLKIETL